MNKLQRNDRQLSKLRRRSQLSHQGNLCVVLEKIPTTMHSSSIMTDFLVKKPMFSFFIAFLSWLYFLSLFTSLYSSVVCAFSCIIGDSSSFKFLPFGPLPT
jgi:hypothetical protein